MAIIKPATPFDSVKRKFSGTDEIHFKNRTADNASGRCCKGYATDNSPKIDIQFTYD